jgi:flavin reductase (DIM6/NTAB) family NADH-FMN oxidoreductase RutF
MGICQEGAAPRGLPAAEFERTIRVVAPPANAEIGLRHATFIGHKESGMHRPIDPAILYFGTPVVLVSSTNPDGSANLAPMSSAWWLGLSCMLGLGTRSHTPANIQRTGECVLNLPSVQQVVAVDRLARTTGSDPVPEWKAQNGYRHVRDKFAEAGLTALPSDLVAPPRAAECPIHLEAVLEAVHPLAVRDSERRGRSLALELRIVRVHVSDEVRLHGQSDRIDPERWRPLIMSFQHFFGLGERVHPSTLAKIPESAYRPALVAAPRLEKSA